jgi:hypothetical protein
MNLSENKMATPPESPVAFGRYAESRGLQSNTTIASVIEKMIKNAKGRSFGHGQWEEFFEALKMLYHDGHFIDVDMAADITIRDKFAESQIQLERMTHERNAYRNQVDRLRVQLKELMETRQKEEEKEHALLDARDDFVPTAKPKKK